MKRYPATVALLALISITFVVQRVTDAGPLSLLALGALPTDGGLHAGYWRILSYSLLHLSQVHLGLNLLAIWWFGPIVERRVGSAKTIGMFAGSALAGGVAVVAAAAVHPHPGYVVGASCGVAGLLAAALVLVYRPDVRWSGPDHRLRIMLWTWLILAITASLLPGVTLAGHLGGAVPAVFAAFLVRLKPEAVAVRQE